MTEYVYLRLMVELIGHYGSDKTHAQSAWTSTNRELTPEKKKRIDKLLTMLAANGHHTPFEKSALHFLINTDIATHIQILKHRVGVSVNAESARYKQIKSGFYVPVDWPTTWSKKLQDHSEQGIKLYNQCLEELSPILGRKRAKESARFFRGYNSQIKADVLFNFRSFYHFLTLRNSPDAQLEIKQLAESMLEIVKGLKCFKHTIKAFGL